MILRYGHPVVVDPIGAHRRTRHEVFHMGKGSYTAGRVLTGKANHVKGGVERHGLHPSLKGGVLPPVTAHPTCAGRDLPTLPASDTGDLVTLREKEPHEAGADMAGTPDDANSHA
jgi:hypothetical protein